MEGQGADHHIERFFGVGVVLYGGLDELDLGGTDHLLGPGQHLVGEVHPHHRLRTMLQSVGAVPAEAAAQVQHPFAGKVGHQLAECVPFPGAGKSVHRAAHLGGFRQKRIVFVFIFFHRWFHPFYRGMAAGIFKNWGWRKPSPGVLFGLFTLGADGAVDVGLVDLRGLQLRQQGR